MPANWKPLLLTFGALVVARVLPKSEVPRTAKPVAASALPAPATDGGLKHLLVALYGEISGDRVLAVAAGVAFYGLLAIFPAITTLVSVYGLFKDRAEAASDLAVMSDFVPEGAMSIISDQVVRITSGSEVSLGLAAIFSLLLAVWSANAGMKALMDALNVAYGKRETRSFVRLNLQSLFFTFSAISFVLLMMGVVAIVPVLLKSENFGPALEWGIWLGRWPALMGVLSLALAVLYRWGPDLPDTKWRWISPGSAVATVGLAVLSIGFSAYAENFGKFNETYGSLGAVIAFLTWLWLLTVIVLVGAELNAELDRRTDPPPSG